MKLEEGSSLLYHAGWKIPERFMKADDGITHLVGVMYKPDFDPNKKYPIISYVYPGPQVGLLEMISVFREDSTLLLLGYKLSL